MPSGQKEVVVALEEVATVALTEEETAASQLVMVATVALAEEEPEASQLVIEATTVTSTQIGAAALVAKRQRPLHLRQWLRIDQTWLRLECVG